jgi:CubicO group peptidase (beta-lactamase class C family)
MAHAARRAALAAALALALGGAALPAQDPFDGLEATLRRELATVGAPGAAVAIARGDRVVWARGVGVANVETGAPATPDMLFQIGSATKTFTAAAVLSAAAQGALALDQPVSRYVTGLAACVGQPTLAELLSHAGGLMDEPDEFGPQGEEGLAAYPRTWTDEYCLVPPGRAFSYTNSGYALAGLALQEVDRTPFADAMRARVLGPLGLRRTTFRPAEAMTWPLAVGHRRGGGGPPTVVRPLANDARLWPAGTLYSSANEMARLAVALLNDGRLDGAQALPPGVAAQMQAARAAIPTTGQSYGYGLFLGADTVGHGGAMTGYSAQMTLDPKARVAVVVLMNGDGANPGPLERVALAAARGQPARPVVAPEVPPTEPRTPATALAAYPGTYANPRRVTVEIVEQDGGLVLKRFGRDFPMMYVSPGRFLVDLPGGGTETLVLGPGPNGRSAWMQMNVWTLARVR